jgi:hypothetical protein
LSEISRNCRPASQPNVRRVLLFEVSLLASTLLLLARSFQGFIDSLAHRPSFLGSVLHLRLRDVAGLRHVFNFVFFIAVLV